MPKLCQKSQYGRFLNYKLIKRKHAEKKENTIITLYQFL